MRDHDKEAELVAEIAKIVYSLNEAGHDSFFEFAGHAELLTIKVHEGSYMTGAVYNEEIWLDYPPGKFKEKGIVGCLEYHRDHIKVLLEETGKKGPDIIAKLKNFIATNTQEKPDVNGQQQEDGKKNETKIPVCPQCRAAATCDELGNLICTNLQCTWQRDENPLFDD